MGDVALIYVGNSGVRYDQDRATPERQLENCVKACGEKGWQPEVYRMPRVTDPDAPRNTGRPQGV